MPAVLAATNLTTVSSTPATGIATLWKPATDNLSQFQLSGTYGTVTLVFEGTIDGTNWSPVASVLASTGAAATGTIALSNDSEVIYSQNAAGFTGIRVAVSAIASGTLTVTAYSNTVAALPANLAITTTGAVTSSSPTAGIGYVAGAGGAVTQITSRTTGVALNTASGAITLVSAAGSATPFSFTLTNSVIAATDTVIINQKSGTDKYTTQVVTAVAAGSCQITLANASGTTTEQPVFNFNVIKGVAA